MFGVVQVEMVGDEGFWAGLAGPGLIAAAAVIAAIVAAITATVRQRRQLDHDLLVRRVEHVRDALDSASEVADAALKSLVRLEVVVEGWESQRPQLDSESQQIESAEHANRLLNEAKEGKDRVIAADKAVTDHMLEMLATTIRLKLRLGSDHEIPALYEELRDCWSEMLDNLGIGETGVRTKQEKADFAQLEDDGSHFFEEFHRACERWLSEAPTFAQPHAARRI